MRSCAYSLEIHEKFLTKLLEPKAAGEMRHFLAALRAPPLLLYHYMIIIIVNIIIIIIIKHRKFQQSCFTLLALVSCSRFFARESAISNQCGAEEASNALKSCL